MKIYQVNIMLKFMKNKILIPLLIVGILAAFFSFTYSNGAARSSEDKRKLVIQAVMKAVDEAHFSPKALDDTFSARVFHKIISDLDHQKIFLTRQDMQKLGVYEFKIDDEIRENSLEFFDSLDAIIVRRQDSAESLTKVVMAMPMNFEVNEDIQLNPDKMDYADGDAGLTERWRKNLKYQMLEKYVELKKEQDKKKENKDSVNVKLKTDEELIAQAKEDTKKSYDRYFKFVHKVKDDTRFMYYVNAIAETEDPHTEYFPPVEKKGFDEMMSGTFFGIGARLSPANDKITVSDIITGSPSWKEGELKSGDEIKKVAQGAGTPVDVQGMELDDVVKLIRGPNATEVRLTVKKTDGSTKIIPIKRGIVEMESTFAKSAIINSKDGPVGYINLPEFYADFNHTNGRSCAVDVAEEVKKLKGAGVTGIILDLRNNGGGSLGDVVDMAGIFVGKGPVVQVKGSNSPQNVLKPQTGDSALYTGPLAIMVNAGSASASEILAAALQDYKRAVIVGSLTYGKGTVQKMVDLDQMVNPMTRLQMRNDTEGEEGKSIGALKLTMEKFYRVSGGSTQLKGVTPDISIPDPYESFEDDDYGERLNRSALPWDEIPRASFTPTNSIPNLPQLESMSESRIAANPTFKLIEENSEFLKKRKDNYSIPLKVDDYIKYEDEINATSKKQEDLMSKTTPLSISNIPVDLAKVNEDSASITRNKDWLKNVSKDIYITETVNIIDDLQKSSMKLAKQQE